MLPDILRDSIMDIEPPAPGKKREKTDDELEEVDLQLALLAYLPVLCLVSVIAKRREDFVSFHASQGLALFLVELASGALFFIPVVGPVLALVVALACLAAAVLAIRTVRRRGRWAIPLVGSLAEQLHL